MILKKCLMNINIPLQTETIVCILLRMLEFIQMICSAWEKLVIFKTY